MKGSFDQLAWEIIHARKPFTRTAGARNSRPLNYKELGEALARGVDFEIAWGDFLHEFFDYRTDSFFVEPPPEDLSLGWQVAMAGAAEFLCKEFGLPLPTWIEEPQFFLDEVIDLEQHEMPYPDYSEQQAERLARTEMPWRRRKLIFFSRNLSTL